MAHRLRSVKVDDGVFLSEKACEHYQCKSCGASMVSVNFVNGVCIQVFVSHKEKCGCFCGPAFQRTAEVTCESCEYYSENNVCIYCGGDDKKINSVRTAV